MTNFSYLLLSMLFFICSHVTSVQAFTVLGTGTAALKGDDLTDRDDDGDEAAYAPPNFAGFDAEFSSSDGAGFSVAGGELAFNVFDNLLGGSVNKWCCSPVSNSVTARILIAPHVLTNFTVSSSNDTPLRDPRVWEVQGSNDGTNFVTIFRQDDPGAALWTARDQVLSFSPEDGDTFLVTDQAFRHFRLATHVTGGGEFALGEIEFFGIPNLPPAITDLDGDNLNYTPSSGAQAIDQSPAATAEDPVSFSNGWDGGSLTVRILSGGVPVEDRLSIVGGTAIGSVSGGTNGLPLEVVFNATASSNLVTDLIRAVAYENLNPTPTPILRTLEFVLRDGDGGVGDAVTVTVTMNVGGAPEHYVWDGGGDGTSFDQALNWDLDLGFPDSNDTAVFATELGNGTGSVDLGGVTRYVERVAFSNSTVQIVNGILATDTVDHAGGTNTIAAQLFSFGFTGSIDGGTLRVSHIENPDTLTAGTWTVTSGRLGKVGTGSLGNTDLDLIDGTLVLEPETSSLIARFVQVINNGVANRQLHTGEIEVFLPGVTPPVDNAGGEGALNPLQDHATSDKGASVFDKNASAGFIAEHSGDDDGRLLNGAENTGANVFGIRGVEAFVTVDLGAARSIGSVRVHQRNDNCCQERLQDFTVNLFADDGGVPGALIDSMAYTNQPPNFRFAELVFSSGATGPVVLNPVDLSGQPAIEIEPGGFGELGPLSLSSIGNVPLEVRAPFGGDLIFHGDSTLHASIEFIGSGQPRIELSNVSGAGGIIKSGDGVLRLPTANSYEGATIINTGLVLAVNGAAFGNPAEGTTVHTGGSIRVTSGTFSEPFTLHGFGNPRSDGALNKQPGGNVFMNGPLTLGADTRVVSSGNSLLLDGGIDLATNTLTLVNLGRIEIRTTPFTGSPGSLFRFEGGNTTVLRTSNPDYLGDIEVFNNGRLEVVADGALGDGAGLSRVLGGEASMFLYNGYTQVEDLELEGDGRGTEGALRSQSGDNTIRGIVLLDGDVEVVTVANTSITIDGPVIGGNQLLQREAGTLVLTQDNGLSNFDIVGGGTIRIHTEEGLGATTNLLLDLGETLEFAGDLSFDNGNALDEIGLAGGTVSAFSGTTSLDISIVADPDQPFNFDGAGTLEIVSSIGNGAGATTNELNKMGTGAVTLHAANTYNGDTFVLAGTLVAANNEALGLGTSLIVEDGASLKLHGGISVAHDALFAAGAGAANQPGVLVSGGGDNTLTANQITALFSEQDELRLASTDGRFTVNAALDLQTRKFSTDGAGDIELNGTISGLSSDLIPTARFVQVQKNIPGELQIGEVEVFAPGTSAVNDHAPGANAPLNNPADLALSPTASIFSASTTGGHGVPGAVIDGLEQTAGTTWNKAQSGGAATAEISIDLGSEKEIDTVRVHQRNDGCCQQRLENFRVNLFADDGGSPGMLVSSRNFPGRPPVDRFGELFFTSVSDNQLVKLGSGTVTLGGSNSYNKGTTIVQGTLLANNASSTGPGLVTVSAGGVLGGTGAVTSNAFIGVRGTVSPGMSIGVLAVNGSLVFSNFTSVYTAELEDAFTADLLAFRQADLNNATLDLRRNPGYTSQLGDELLIGASPFANGVKGTFNGLPEGASVSAQGEEFTISYLLGEITLTATGNPLVYAGPDVITRTETNAVTVDAATLLANDLAGAGASLSITGVMTNGNDGGVIALSGSMITYTPPPGYEGNDSFTYTVSDGVNSATGLVTVQRVDATSGEIPVADPSGSERLPDGDYRVSFIGTPGAPYRVEWTQEIRVEPINWQNLGVIVADNAGLIVIDHVAPPPGVLYYRAAAE